MFRRLIDWIKSFWVNKPVEPQILEHRGMKAYFSPEMIEEFENSGVDYEKAFREAIDEMLDEEMEEDKDNPYV